MVSQGEQTSAPASYTQAPFGAEAHFASIVASTDDAIISKTLDGVIRSWNPAAQKIFGYTAEEAVGQSILMLLPDERKDEETIILARLRRGERIEHFETVRQAKDGTRINVSVTISPIRNAQGDIVGASKIARNINDRIAADATRARLAAIVESSDDAIVGKTLQGIIQSWNRGAERLFGYMAEEMIGRPIDTLLPPERKDEEIRILERLRRGERVDHFETVRVRKDGRRIDVSVTISPIRDSTGTIIGASKVARDISERKILEATMARLTEDLEGRVRERTSALETAHREMEAFTHSIAHDLRGPLRAIVATSTLVIEDYGDILPDEGKTLLNRQILSAKRLSQLVNDLLSYSKLGQGGLNVVELDLSAIAREIAEDLKPLRTQCDIQVEDGLAAWGDELLVKLLLQNLLDNACKFSPNGGLVEVGKSADVFFVRDHGIGFNMAFAEKIFAPFERLVRNDDVPGTGIGLANVKRIIERHGGSIWVQSVQGEGTTFFFTLPKRGG